VATAALIVSFGHRDHAREHEEQSARETGIHWRPG
jgi:hypothetical protein